MLSASQIFEPETLVPAASSSLLNESRIDDGDPGYFESGNWNAVPSGSAGEVFENTGDVVANWHLGNSNSQQTLRQIFNLNSGGLIDQVTFTLGKSGSPVGNLWAEIRDASDTILATSNTISTTSIGASPAEIAFTFPGQETLPDGDSYVVLNRNYPISSSNYVTWGATFASAIPGTRGFWNGSSWNHSSSYSIKFKVETLSTPDPDWYQGDARQAANNTANTASWTGQTISPGSQTILIRASVQSLAESNLATYDVRVDGVLQYSFNWDQADAEGQWVDIDRRAATLPGGVLSVELRGNGNGGNIYADAIEITTASAGDFEPDGDVDNDDLKTWETGFGLPGNAALADGDADGDNDVDGFDFLLWQRNYAAAPQISELEPLRVSQNGRYLETDAGPFFWQADTAWGLAELSPQEVEQYMAIRAASRFNVIQGPILFSAGSFANFTTPEQSIKPNYAGETVFSSMEPLTLNEAYLQHLDTIVDKAAEQGLYIAIPVVWGSTFDRFFDVNNPSEAYDVGYQLGHRYSDRTNVIWIVSGEYQKIAWETEPRDRTTPNAAELNLIEHLAQGLEAGHGGNNLMTIHPDGDSSSSDYFHNAAWLDFNMIQTFHINTSAGTIVQNDWNLNPAKPVLNAEPAYEDRNVGTSDDPIDAWKTRVQAYASVFQGALGHTYGQWDIWQGKDSSGQFVDTNGVDWWDDLHSEGAQDMQHLRALVESRPMLSREPFQPAILGSAGDLDNLERVFATRGDGGGYLFVYFPQEASSVVGKMIDLTQVNGPTINAWWYNTRDGQTYNTFGHATSQPFATFNNNTTSQWFFDPPGGSTSRDWVLVLDDASKAYGIPGMPWGANALLAAETSTELECGTAVRSGTPTQRVGRYSPTVSVGWSTQVKNALVEQEIDNQITEDNRFNPQSDQFWLLVDTAAAYWRTRGVSSELLDSLEIQTTDLSGDLLGFAQGSILWIDVDAAGHGWYVDRSPWNALEFGTGAEPLGMDLLTVLAHEMGHALGHAHDSSADGVMAERLAPGERHLTIQALDAAHASLVEEVFEGIESRIF